MAGRCQIKDGESMNKIYTVPLRIISTSLVWLKKRDNLKTIKISRSLNRAAVILCLFFVLGINIFDAQAQPLKNINPAVLREASLWHLQAEKEAVVTYFSCSVVNCERLGIREEGFYKAYFEDGFVLTISLSGKIIDHYYNPSPNGLRALEKSLFTSSMWNFRDLPIERKRRLTVRSDDLERFFGLKDLYNGNFEEAIRRTGTIMSTSKENPRILSTALAVKALAHRELGKKQEFSDSAEKAYSLDSDNPWSRRAMAILHIEKGNLSEALKTLQTSTKEELDRLLEAIAYGKLGNMENAAQVFGEISEEYLVTKSIFLQKYIMVAQNLLKPYKQSKLKTARDYESRRLHREAVKEYQDFLKFADEKEAKELRAHIAALMVNYPHLFALPEEARRMVIRAEAFTSEGNFERAIEEYKKALKLQPFFPALYKALALNYAQLKDYKQAIRNMQIYLDLYPDAPDSRAAKDEIYRWEAKMEIE
ncbi:MAG: tetratricopeptide repeat protein [Candidatus Bathyarchaeia archaeon]